MRNILTIIVLSIGTQCWGFDHNVVIGQWAAYQIDDKSQESYYFLNINDDLSGILISSFYENQSIRDFKASDIIKEDGYLVINFNTNQKAILSAWKLKSGSGRLVGIIYLYKENGELFNMIHFPLKLLNNNHDLMNHKVIKELSEKHR